MPFVAVPHKSQETDRVMKTPTNRLSVQRAFSLVELLVVIAVIAIIAAIAIPNIANITGQAGVAANQRNAQNVASMFAAATAAGATTASWGGSVTIANVVSALTNSAGVLVTNAVGGVSGPFRMDGLGANTNFYQYLDDSTSGTIRYKP